MADGSPLVFPSHSVTSGDPPVVRCHFEQSARRTPLPPLGRSRSPIRAVRKTLRPLRNYVRIQLDTNILDEGEPSPAATNAPAPAHLCPYRHE